MERNIIKAVFTGDRYCKTRKLTRQDFGAVLQFVNASLPENFQVHFSHARENTGTAKTWPGTRDGGVTIPDEYLLTGLPVYAWVFVQTETSGWSAYVVEMPVDAKPTVTNAPPTLREKTAWDEAIERLNTATDAAEEAVSHYPKIESGTWWVWDVLSEQYVDTGYAARGEDGTDGVSPTVEIDEITGGHRVTITDAEHPQGQPFDVMDGEDGQAGPAGKSAYESAQDGGYSKTESQFNTDLAGVGDKYEKPSGGIPKTDLASDVQTSLGKADTALQEHQSLAAYRTSAVQDVIDAGKLSLSGGTMTGAIAMGGNKVTGLSNGTNAQDAVTKAQLDAAVIGALKPSGSITFASLPALTASVLNNVYNITDAFTTTSDFVEGAGKTYPAGSNVAIINVGTELTPVYKYDVYTGIIDLSPYRTAAAQDVIDQTLSEDILGLKSAFDDIVLFRADLTALGEEVPFNVSAGDSVTVRSADGSNMTPTRIRFMRPGGGTDYWGLGGGKSQISISITETFVAVYLEGGTAQHIVVTRNGSYLDYDQQILSMNRNLTSLNKMEPLVMFRADLTELGTEVPLALENGDTVTVRSADGTVMTPTRIRFVRPGGGTDYETLATFKTRTFSIAETFVAVYLEGGTAQHIVVTRNGSYLDYDPQILAIDAKIGNSATRTKSSTLTGAIAELATTFYSGVPANNEMLFDNTMVQTGDHVRMAFNVAESGVGAFVEILDTSNQRITYIGRPSIGHEVNFNIDYQIPGSFGKAVARCPNSELTIYTISLSDSSVSYLWEQFQPIDFVEQTKNRLTDLQFSLDNRLANPIFESLEHYNSAHSGSEIVAENVLYKGITGAAAYRIPTCCVTNDGTILVAGTHMTNAEGDYGDFSIDMARKTTGGSWSVENVIPFDSSRTDYGSVLNNEFLVDRTSGRIYLFYGTEKQKVVWWDVSTEDGDMRYVYSDDDGENWSEPVSLKSLWDTTTYDYCIPSCTKGITLTNGTLVVPCFCKKGTGSTAISYPLLLIKKPLEDWYLSSVASIDGYPRMDECAVVEGAVANTIWLYCRPNYNYGTGIRRGYNKFVYNISNDTFEHQECTFDGNRHNCFSIDSITLSSTKIFLMSFTDTNNDYRDNITLWGSLDGNTWIRIYRINKGRSNGYSVVDNYNGVIAVAYEYKDTTLDNTIACQNISQLDDLIYDSVSGFIEKNISVQDRMQMIYNHLAGID